MNSINCPVCQAKIIESSEYDEMSSLDAWIYYNCPSCTGYSAAADTDSPTQIIDETINIKNYQVWIRRYHNQNTYWLTIDWFPTGKLGLKNLVDMSVPDHISLYSLEAIQNYLLLQ